MEWILGILILILGGVAILIVYLSERISVFETLLGLNPKVTTEKLAEHVNFGPNPFGDLSGEILWKAMSGETITNEEVDVSDIESMRPRYELVITRHIEMLVEDGRFDGRAGERSAVKSVARIPMLRGSVESFLPYVEAARLYEIGQEAEQTPEKIESLAAEVDELVDELFLQVQLERRNSFGRSLLPADNIDADINDLDLPDSITTDTTTLALPSEDSSVRASDDPKD